MVEDEYELREKLAAYQTEHRDLDAMLDRLQNAQPVDLLQLQRLKKRKLWLKDMIQKIEDDLLPDIIA